MLGPVRHSAWYAPLRNGFILLMFLLLLPLLVSLNFLWLFGKSPDLAQLENPAPALPTEVYTADGVLLGRYFTENRRPVSYAEISPNVTKALVSIEDERFYEHSGVDIRGLAGLVRDALRGEGRGGSTLTQQFAKNLYKTRGQSSKGLLGAIPGISTLILKLKEWITAVRIERNFTKSEIIALYLNTVDFGNRSFGIKTASRTYFSRSPDSLNTAQAALLIGLLKAPTTYNPFRQPKNAIARRGVVLAQMRRLGKISSAEYSAALKARLPAAPNYQRDDEGPADYFRGVLSAWLKDWADSAGYDIYTDGLKIYTTIDSRVQALAEAATQEQMKTLQRRFNDHWRGMVPWTDDHDVEIKGFIEANARRTPRWQALAKSLGGDTAAIMQAMKVPVAMRVFTYRQPNGVDTVMSPIDSIKYFKKFLHAGMTVMDPYSAQVKAWVGGINYGFFPYDHVFQAKRQPGSTFKAFCYAEALKQGIEPCDSIVDKPVTIQYVEDGKNMSWSPHNADGIFTYQPMTIRRAFAASINTAAAQVTQMVTPDSVARMARDCGIESPLKAVPSIALGSNDVNLFELVGAYCTFMNAGRHARPSFITRIEDRYGNQVQSFSPQWHQAISPKVAWLMTWMLRGGVEEWNGTSQALFQYQIFRNNEIGGKTGTSTNQSDGWFIGLTRDLVAGAWVGGEDRAIHFRSGQLGEGSKTALPIVGLFLEKLYADKDLRRVYRPGYFPKPSVKIDVDYSCRMYAPKDTLGLDTLLPPVELIPLFTP